MVRREGGKEREKKKRNGYGGLRFGRVAFPKSFQIYIQVMIFWKKKQVSNFAFF
jgi:hypothetical protein